MELPVGRAVGVSSLGPRARRRRGAPWKRVPDRARAHDALPRPFSHSPPAPPRGPGGGGGGPARLARGPRLSFLPPPAGDGTRTTPSPRSEKTEARRGS